VPAGKLGLGIGFYGSCWTAPVNGPLQDLGGSALVADDDVMTYDHIMTAYYADAAYHWDAAAQVPYLGFAAPHGPEGCTFVSYEDQQSIAAKGQYAHDHGLGGAIVWTINEGHRPTQPDLLMTAVKLAFLQ
jgi:chitinase